MEVRKQRRNPRACDACNRRSVRCQPNGRDPRQCQNCVEYGEACTYQRIIHKRGARPKPHRTGSLPASAANTERQSPRPPPGLCQRSRPLEDHVDSALDDSVSQALVMDLAEIFFEVVYPVFPLFHRPSLLRRVARGEHVSDHAFRASIMAMCALSSARARDGALYSGTWDTSNLQHPSSEELFDMARRSIPDDAPLDQNFDIMRACALLAITAIQYGRSDLMHYYLNIYHTFTAVGALHDEANWPSDLSAIELEERRRLFWSIYTLDIFTAVIWSGTVRSREASSDVSYPFRLDEEMAHSPAANEISLQSRTIWLTGWNFVTDLYRILEHAVDDLRRVRTPVQRTPHLEGLANTSVPSGTTVLDHIMAMYNRLPDEFKSIRQTTGRLEDDLFGFQAANIAATVQLVRMIYFTNDHSTLEQKCQVAREVIAGFATVPVTYLRAISVPLLHHLAGIGTILGAAFEYGMTESSYRRVRFVLLEMADLIANLEVDLYCPSGTSSKLQAQVSRIDEYMNTHREMLALQSNHHPQGIEDVNSSDILQAPVELVDDQSPQWQFPAELFEDWEWLTALPEN